MKGAYTNTKPLPSQGSQFSLSPLGAPRQLAQSFVVVSNIIIDPARLAPCQDSCPEF